MIEVEKLGTISGDTYKKLGAEIMALGGSDLGENNTNTVFFVSDESRVKVQHNTSKNTAKIAWKSGGGLDGVSARQEIELEIDPSRYENAVELLTAMLASSSKISSNQTRHDYRLGDVSIAVKHSEDYGYHVEFDLNVESEDETGGAEAEIFVTAERLNIRVLSASEEEEFIQNSLVQRGKL